ATAPAAARISAPALPATTAPPATARRTAPARSRRGRSPADALPVRPRAGVSVGEGLLAHLPPRRSRDLRLLRATRTGAAAARGPQRPTLLNGNRLRRHAASPLPGLRRWRQ